MLCEYHPKGSVVIMITDLHGEYPIPDPQALKSWARRDTIWPRTFHWTDTRRRLGVDEAEEVVEQLFIQLVGGKAVTERWNSTHVNQLTGQEELIQLSADFDTMVAWFRAFLSTLGGARGGDDDTFDYWPNAMGMAADWARALDEVHSTQTYIEEVRAVFDAVDAAEGHEWSESGDWIRP